MKPMKLELTAFGSYAAPTVIPFDALGPSLYLITGDTDRPAAETAPPP